MAPKQDLPFERQFYESVLAKIPDDFPTIELLGGIYTKLGLTHKGLEMDLKALQIKPNNPIVNYNVACSYALLNDHPQALHFLSQSINLGYNDLHWLLHDPDLSSLHNLPEFQSLAQFLKKNAPPQDSQDIP